MTNSGDEQQPDDSNEGITDDKLPEDLRPTDDNPLAKPIGDDEDEESMKGSGPAADSEEMGNPGSS